MDEEFVVGPEDEGCRLDRFLAERIPDVSRSRLQKWLNEGRVSISSSKPPKSSLQLRAGWVVSVTAPEAEISGLVPEDLPLDVIHEDEDLLVIRKPAGLTVHPGAGRRTGTLVHRLIARDPERAWPGPPERPGIVHRLDRETSGLLVVAKTDHAYVDLVRQISSHAIQRGYIALVWGTPAPAKGTIDGRIDRDPRDRRRMTVVRSRGRAARTHFRLLRSFDVASLLDLRLETGRTHQIRVHMASIGFPVFGDPVYGGGRAFLARVDPRDRPIWTQRVHRLNRQALHAYHLGLRHPRDQRLWVFEAPPPDDLDRLLMELEAGA